MGTRHKQKMRFSRRETRRERVCQDDPPEVPTEPARSEQSTDFFAHFDGIGLDL